MIDDAGSKTVLKEICMSADLLAACREQIATDGLTIPTRNGSRDHPLEHISAELNLRFSILRG